MLSGQHVIATSTVHTFNNRKNYLSSVVEPTGEITDSQMPGKKNKKTRQPHGSLAEQIFGSLFFFQGLFLVVLHYATHLDKFLLSTLKQNCHEVTHLKTALSKLRFN